MAKQTQRSSHGIVRSDEPQNAHRQPHPVSMMAGAASHATTMPNDDPAEKVLHRHPWRRRRDEGAQGKFKMHGKKCQK